jgi:hypothetical protein
VYFAVILINFTYAEVITGLSSYLIAQDDDNGHYKNKSVGGNIHGNVVRFLKSCLKIIRKVRKGKLFFFWVNLCSRVFIHSYFVGPSAKMPRMHLSLGLIVQPLSVHLAQIQQPCAFYVEAEVSY